MANQIHLKALLIMLFIFFIYNPIIIGQGIIKNGTNTIIKHGTYFISDNDLTVESGGELYIEGFTTVYGTLVNNGGIDGIKVISNSLNSGSLIFTSGTPNASIERYCTDGQWHLIISPVDGADANQVFYNNDPIVWLKEYNEPSNDWSYITDLNTSLDLGKGFAYWVSTAREDVVITYEGDLNSGDLTLNSSSIPPINYTDVDHGYNLIGNPFTSAIDWDDASWVYTDIEETVWVWQDGGSGDGSGNYLYRNKNEMGNLTDGIIPYGQGFFVRATAATGLITIPSAARTHSSQEFYKKGKSKSELDFQYLVLDVIDESDRDQIWIAFKDEATDNFDNGWDVSKFFITEDVPRLYLNEANEELSIDVLPPLDTKPRSIAMGFIPGAEGDQLIVASIINDFDEVEIILEDKKTAIFHDLKDNNTYQFISEISDNPERFDIHFNPVITSDDEEFNVANEIIIIFSSNKTIFIKNSRSSNDFKEATITVYDLTGRQMKEVLTHCSSLISIPVQVNNSYLIVKYRTDNKIVTEKVFIK